MALIDFILNLAGLLLWLAARATRFDPLVKTSAASLAGTLRRAEPIRIKGRHYLVALLALLVIRAWLYWQIGYAVNWVPSLRLGAIAISFRSDMLGRMLLFSALSFAVTLAVFYLWLLLFSLVNARSAEPDSVERLVRLHLGHADRWPWPIKLFAPLVLGDLLWLGLSALLTRWNIIPPAVSTACRIEQGIIICLGGYLTWKYLIGALLVLSLVSSYVYFGNHPLWNFINLTGRNLVAPFRVVPLRIGKVDFAPIVGLALVFVVGVYAERGLTSLYQRLPI